MKAKLNTLLSSAFIMLILASCSTSKYASAQDRDYDDNYAYQQNDNYNGDYNGNDDYNNYDQPQVNINVFSDALSPYGRWVTSPSYGQVWICNEPGFTPYYSGGNWSYTNFGWTWVSNYRWGWAPFHYGRWAYDPFYGWMWVPGYEWGPAWVSWRSSSYFYGWAPLSPGINISVGISFGNTIPADRWCFVPRRYVTSPYLHNYRVAPSRNITIINNSTTINNINVYKNNKFIVGPNRAEVERATGRKIKEESVRNIIKAKNYNIPLQSGQKTRAEVINNKNINNQKTDVVINNRNVNIQKAGEVNNNNKPNTQKPEVIKNNKDVKAQKIEAMPQASHDGNNPHVRNMPVRKNNQPANSPGNDSNDDKNKNQAPVQSQQKIFQNGHAGNTNQLPQKDVKKKTDEVFANTDKLNNNSATVNNDKTKFQKMNNGQQKNRQYNNQQATNNRKPANPPVANNHIQPQVIKAKPQTNTQQQPAGNTKKKKP